MTYRIKLTIFRSGLFLCFVWGLFTATHFHLPSSLIAVWEHTPTRAEIATQWQQSAEKQSACVRAAHKTIKQEFPLSCIAEGEMLVTTPRDVAWKNLEEFLGASAVLALGITLLSWLGLRMAREAESIELLPAQPMVIAKSE